MGRDFPDLYARLYHWRGGAIGAVVMEFNADVIYKSKLRAMLYSGALALVIVGGCTFITMLCLRRLATPFYKKLAYTDMPYRHRQP